eukprot:gene2952-1934_t
MQVITQSLNNYTMSTHLSLQSQSLEIKLKLPDLSSENTVKQTSHKSFEHDPQQNAPRRANTNKTNKVKPQTTISHTDTEPHTNSYQINTRNVLLPQVKSSTVIRAPHTKYALNQVPNKEPSNTATHKQVKLYTLAKVGQLILTTPYNQVISLLNAKPKRRKQNHKQITCNPCPSKPTKLAKPTAKSNQIWNPHALTVGQICVHQKPHLQVKHHTYGIGCITTVIKQYPATHKNSHNNSKYPHCYPKSNTHNPPANNEVTSFHALKSNKTKDYNSQLTNACSIMQRSIYQIAQHVSVCNTNRSLTNHKSVHHPLHRNCNFKRPTSITYTPSYCSMHTTHMCYNVLTQNNTKIITHGHHQKHHNQNNTSSELNTI